MNLITFTSTWFQSSEKKGTILAASTLYESHSSTSGEP